MFIIATILNILVIDTLLKPGRQLRCDLKRRQQAQVNTTEHRTTETPFKSNVIYSPASQMYGDVSRRRTKSWLHKVQIQIQNRTNENGLSYC